MTLISVLFNFRNGRNIIHEHIRMGLKDILEKLSKEEIFIYLLLMLFVLAEFGPARCYTCKQRVRIRISTLHE